MAWPQDAYVGQKVVCIESTLCEGLLPNETPAIKGHIYTIRQIIAWPTSGVGFLFYEIVDPPVNHREGKSERTFPSSQFRPVQSTERGMEILRKLQNPTNHRVRISEDA